MSLLSLIHFGAMVLHHARLHGWFMKYFIQGLEPCPPSDGHPMAVAQQDIIDACLGSLCDVDTEGSSHSRRPVLSKQDAPVNLPRIVNTCTCSTHWQRTVCVCLHVCTSGLVCVMLLCVTKTLPLAHQGDLRTVTNWLTGIAHINSPQE